MNLLTYKSVPQGGKGSRPDRFIIGEHAPPNSPFYYMPAYPEMAMALNPSWFFHDWRASYATTEWTATAVGAASAVTKTTNGAWLFTNDSADNDLMQLQGLPTWTPAANAFAACYMRVQVSDATQHDFYAGFSSTDTSVVASAPADYAMFKKDDGDTILNGASNDAGGSASETANLITNWTAATDYDLGVVLLASSTTAGTMMFCYKLASSNTWSMVTKTSDFPDAAVRFTLLSMNGEAVAKTMTVKRWMYTMFAG